MASPGTGTTVAPACAVPLLTPFRQERRLRDAAIRIVGIPVLGLGIPRLTGVFQGISPGDPLYWAGTLWFVGLFFLLRMGSRWLLFRLRDRHDWARRPLVKLFSLLGATTAFTLIVGGAMMLAWHAVLATRPSIRPRCAPIRLVLGPEPIGSPA